MIDINDTPEQVWTKLTDIISELRILHTKPIVGNGYITLSNEEKTRLNNKGIEVKERVCLVETKELAYEYKNDSNPKGAMSRNGNRYALHDRTFTRNDSMKDETKAFIYIKLNKNGQSIRMDRDNQFYISAITDASGTMHNFHVNYGNSSMATNAEEYIRVLKSDDYFAANKPHLFAFLIAECCRSKLVESVFKKLFEDEAILLKEAREGAELLCTNYSDIYQAVRTKTKGEDVIAANKDWKPLEAKDYNNWMQKLRENSRPSYDRLQSLINFLNPKPNPVVANTN